MKGDSYIPVINRFDSCKIKVSDIRVVYRTRRKINFETDHGVKTTYERMNNIEKMLGPEFVRCMSGCMINLDRVTEMSGQHVYFDTGESLRLGRDAYLKAKQRFNAYLRDLLPENVQEQDEGKQD